MHKLFETYTYPADFITESGEVLHQPALSYTTYGTINSDGSNVVWVCHALTADSDVFSWWEGLFGPTDIFNPEDYFIICVNNPGSCYGSVGPLSVHPQTGKIHGHDFPNITVRDVAKLFDSLRSYLKIEKIYALIGGSQGGHIAQELILTARFFLAATLLLR
jgi:homoserine O-acetyltransferase